MSATLPKNLAVVADDLARATLIDARRSLKRRRLVTCAVAFALLAFTAATAVANGWLFARSSTVRAAPGLTGDASGSVPAPPTARAAARQMAQSEAQHRAANPDPGLAAPIGAVQENGSKTLLDDLGEGHRTLSSVLTSNDGVCIVLSGFPVQCPPNFAAGQEIIWSIASPAGEPTVIWGVARSEVTAIEAVLAGGRTVSATLANDAFFIELDEQPKHLLTHLEDGSTSLVPLLPCPLTTPDCTR